MLFSTICHACLPFPLRNVIVASQKLIFNPNAKPNRIISHARSLKFLNTQWTNKTKLFKVALYDLDRFNPWIHAVPYLIDAFPAPPKCKQNTHASQWLACCVFHVKRLFDNCHTTNSALYVMKTKTTDRVF